tara:strand:+ start:130 stop:360 length:231 start_codon:yes stop_codon:yes gene_type:complete
METLDLHDLSHKEAENLTEEFIIKNFTNMPIEIITGNSINMQKILKIIVKEHNLRIVPSHANNLGSYIINQQLNNG